MHVPERATQDVLTWTQNSSTIRKMKPQTDVTAMDSIIAQGPFQSALFVSSASCVDLHNIMIALRIIAVASVK